MAGFGIIPDLDLAVEALFHECPLRDLASVTQAANLGALTGPCQEACAGNYSHNDPIEVSAHWQTCNAMIWERADALASGGSGAARAACAGVVRARLEQAFFGSLFNSTVTDCGGVFEVVFIFIEASFAVVFANCSSLCPTMYETPRWIATGPRRFLAKQD